MSSAHVYQILNHYTSRDALDPGFLVLDNSANERPDWFEYWPIRRFLRTEPLDEALFYGFLSPKFRLKTNLGAAAVHDFVGAAPPEVDAVLFSPSIQNSAVHWNVFAHGESEHPGLLATAEAFFTRIGRPSDLHELVTDSRNIVNSNYFLARPRFWREWLVLTEALFAIAEDARDALGAQLRAATSYRGEHAVPMKIFIVERLATWLLASDTRYTALVCDPFAAGARLYKLPVAIVCDALKIAYATQGRGQYRDVFRMVQGLRKTLNWQIRLGSAAHARRVRPWLDALAAYWHWPAQ
jgi:hypothetical protein